MYTGDRVVGVTTMLMRVAPRVVFVTACGATGRCGVVTQQHLSVLVFISYEYTCHKVVTRADMFMSFMFIFTMINDWLIDRLYFD